MNSIEPPPLSFVACHLRQPATTSRDHTTSKKDHHRQQYSWGLWVSLRGHDKTALVVAHIQKHSFDPLVQWSKTTASPLDASIVWNQSYGSYGNDLWKSYFSLAPSSAGADSSTTSGSNNNNNNNNNTLLPGDVIVAINGLPISAFGGSIGIVTTYLRQCHELFLVSARTSSASMALQLTQEKPSSGEQVRTRSGNMVYLEYSFFFIKEPRHIYYQYILLTVHTFLFSDTAFLATSFRCHWPHILQTYTGATFSAGI